MGALSLAAASAAYDETASDLSCLVAHRAGRWAALIGTGAGDDCPLVAREFLGVCWRKCIMVGSRPVSGSF